MKKLNNIALMFITLLMISSAAISAPLSKATVTLQDSATGKIYTCITDANGKFECKNLPDGKYSITCKNEADMMNWSFGAAAYQFEVQAPKDRASGQASGKRMHKPLTITKEFDKSTPMLGKRAGSPPSSTKNQNNARSNRCVATVCVDGTTISGTITDK